MAGAEAPASNEQRVDAILVRKVGGGLSPRDGRSPRPFRSAWAIWSVASSRIAEFFRRLRGERVRAGRRCGAGGVAAGMQ
jgi:hypothetical protein